MGRPPKRKRNRGISGHFAKKPSGESTEDEEADHERAVLVEPKKMRSVLDDLKRGELSATSDVPLQMAAVQRPHLTRTSEAAKGDVDDMSGPAEAEAEGEDEEEDEEEDATESESYKRLRDLMVRLSEAIHDRSSYRVKSAISAGADVNSYTYSRHKRHGWYGPPPLRIAASLQGCDGIVKSHSCVPPLPARGERGRAKRQAEPTPLPAKRSASELSCAYGSLRRPSSASGFL